MIFSPWPILLSYKFLLFLLLIGHWQSAWTQVIMLMIGGFSLIAMVVCGWWRLWTTADHEFWVLYQSLYGTLAVFSIFFWMLREASFVTLIVWWLGILVFSGLVYVNKTQ